MVLSSSSHGGERKRQLGLAITVSVSGRPLSGWGPHNKQAPFIVRAPPTGPTHLVVSHSQILLWQVPIAFFFRLHESSNPRPQGPILKWGALSQSTELAQLVVRVLPISIKSLWSWVRTLTEAKEKGNWDLP